MSRHVTTWSRTDIYTRRRGGELARQNAFFFIRGSEFFFRSIFCEILDGRHVSDYRAPREEYFHIIYMRMRKREKGLSAKSSASRPSNRLRQRRGHKKDRQGKGHFSDLSLLPRWQWLILHRAALTSHYARGIDEKMPICCVGTSNRKISNYYAATHLHVDETWRPQLWHLFWIPWVLLCLSFLSLLIEGRKKRMTGINLQFVLLIADGLLK